MTEAIPQHEEDDNMCEAAMRDYNAQNHECWEIKGHDGPHRCVVCAEEW